MSSRFFRGHTSPPVSTVEREETSMRDPLEHRNGNKKRKAKGKERKKLQRGLISYINVQGGRKPTKWLDIEEQLNREQIAVYAVTETYFRDSEEPPIIANYVWEGCNRTKSERKGGGIGMLIHREANWCRVTSTCEEHLWVSGTVSGKKTMLSVVYMWTGNNCKEKNQKLVNCISKDIQKFGNGAEIILLGDMLMCMTSTDIQIITGS